MNLSGRHNMPAVARFWARVRKSRKCWLWTNVPKSGKPVLKVKGKSMAASRFSYELHIGPIPQGLLVCHTCDVPHCMNPMHLFLGTPAINMEDKTQKGRQTKGEEVNTSKLTEEEVLELRRLYRLRQMTQVELAVRYGIDQSTVSQIVLRKSWKHLKQTYPGGKK